MKRNHDLFDVENVIAKIAENSIMEYDAWECAEENTDNGIAKQRKIVCELNGIEIFITNVWV